MGCCAPASGENYATGGGTITMIPQHNLHLEQITNRPKTLVEEDDEFFEKSMILEDEELSNILQIHLSCKNLPNLDLLSKTDPIAIVYERSNKTNDWVEKGRTEMIKDCLDPIFIKTIDLNYTFHQIQQVRIVIYNINDSSDLFNLSKQELVGDCVITIQEILRSKSQTLTTSLSNPKLKKNGSVSIWGEQFDPKMSSQMIKLKVEGRGIRNKAFYKLSKSKGIASKEMVPIFRSEILKSSANMWKPASIHTSVLCQNDFTRNIQIELFEWKSNGSHRSIIQHNFTLNSIENDSIELELPNDGELVVHEYIIEKEYTFMEYLNGGIDLGLLIAIDFSASNLPPSNSDSLHHTPQSILNQTKENSYQGALEDVGSILESYNNSQRCPIRVISFGTAADKAQSKLIGEATNIEQVHDLYLKYKLKVEKDMLEPTMLTKVFQFVKHQLDINTNSKTKSYDYLILLIITDGIIDDFTNTVNALVELSNQPLSVIIIGVGNANFSQMEKLDADEDPLKSSKTGKYMSRDIVQFVPYEKYREHKQALAKHTLAEIPRQVIEYFNSIGYVPFIPS